VLAGPTPTHFLRSSGAAVRCLQYRSSRLVDPTYQCRFPPRATTRPSGAVQARRRRPGLPSCSRGSLLKRHRESRLVYFLLLPPSLPLLGHSYRTAREKRISISQHRYVLDGCVRASLASVDGYHPSIINLLLYVFGLVPFEKKQKHPKQTLNLYKKNKSNLEF
jgi:hypothetical protein